MNISYHFIVSVLLTTLSIFSLFQVLGFISEYAENERRRENKISVFRMIDVGQGDGAMIRLWSGHIFFIDIGEKSDRFIRGVQESMSGSNITQFNSVSNFGKKNSMRADIIFLSHDDADHAGSLVGMFDSLDKKIGSLAVSPYMYTYVEKLNDKLNGTKISESALNILKIGQGDRLEFFSEKTDDELMAEKKSVAKIDILYPKIYPKAYSDTHPKITSEYKSEYKRRAGNDDSIVMSVVIASTSILFTGDISEKVERQLVDMYHDRLKTDILKVAHHGSKSSSDENFIQKTNPYIALISVGKNNRYKHPSKQALKRLEQDGREIIRTDICGTYDILVYQDGVIGREGC